MNALQDGQEKFIISIYCFGRHSWLHLTTRKQYILPLYGINLLRKKLVVIKVIQIMEDSKKLSWKDDMDLITWKH